MNITILTTIEEKDGTHKRLTKVFSRSSSGDLIKADYDRAFLFDASTIDIEGIEQLSAVLTWLEAQPNSCVIRGETINATKSIRRALVDDPARGHATIRPVEAGVSWVMLDFDKLPVASLNLSTERDRLDYLVSLLPEEFQGVSYHYQWSSSAGLDGWQTLSAHLWFWLDQPWPCRTLYERFATGDFASCEVDPAPFTSNQVHYTANPIFKGITDPVQARSGLVRGVRDDVALSVWIKPVEAAPALSNRDHYQRFGLSRFDDLLADIGPHYHRPILRAVGHYYAVVKPEDQDREDLIVRLRHAIETAPAGRSRKADYTARAYLDRVIDGAARKYGRAF